jgi:hypothetical protein
MNKERKNIYYSGKRVILNTAINAYIFEFPRKLITIPSPLLRNILENPDKVITLCGCKVNIYIYKDPRTNDKYIVHDYWNDDKYLIKLSNKYIDLDNLFIKGEL